MSGLVSLFYELLEYARFSGGEGGTGGGGGEGRILASHLRCQRYAHIYVYSSIDWINVQLHLIRSVAFRSNRTNHQVACCMPVDCTLFLVSYLAVSRADRQYP
jgi:hypothetical protein